MATRIGPGKPTTRRDRQERKARAERLNGPLRVELASHHVMVRPPCNGRWNWTTQIGDGAGSVPSWVCSTDADIDEGEMSIPSVGRDRGTR